MWIVIVSYSRTNETFHYESLADAEKKYKKVKESGRVAYLTHLIQSNV